MSPCLPKMIRKFLPCRVIATLSVLLLAITYPALSIANVTAANAELRDFLKSTISDATSFEDRFDAEVWLVDMSARLKPFIKEPKERLEMLKAIHREATKADLKPDLVLALIQVESGFDSYAISSAGAQGLMQVMPFWKDEIGRPEDNLTDMNTNLSYGCRILQFYLKKENGNWMYALARYNGSYGKFWYPERVMNAWRKRWFLKED